MIDYLKGIYGTNLLRRVHGSALYRGSLVGLLSVLVYLLIVLRWNDNGRHYRFPPPADGNGGGGGHRHGHDGGSGDGEGDLNDPLAVGVLVSSVTFLIVFRANTGYQRYWEACTHLHHYLSKSSDVAMQTATFHLQCRHYDGVRPRDFYRHHAELDDMRINLDRTRGGGSGGNGSSCPREGGDGSRDDDHDDDDDDDDGGGGGGDRHRDERRDSRARGKRGGDVGGASGDDSPSHPDATGRAELHSRLFPPAARMAADAATPPLFLQELAHLSSLACAVALSTLRNDESVSRYESPLDAYVPGMDWPSVDPDSMPRRRRNDFQPPHHLLTLLMYWLGLDRLPRWRARYNAARPLHVLGGVSDSEVSMLRSARGSHAKAELANAWLREFIIRESLSGSLGDVHSSIISRVVQNMSDAAAGYYQARKVTYIPFPFPHAQLCAFFTFVMVFAVPFMMDQYADMPYTGIFLTFLTVTCLVGLHEVARELENPFRNVPNEIPLCALQASYNETLLTMFEGYNPDAMLWDPERTMMMAARRHRRGGDREGRLGVGIRNTTAMTTTMIGKVPTTTLTDSMTTTTSAVIECQPKADDVENDGDDDDKIITSEECEGTVKGDDCNVAKVLLEKTLAKQAIEIEELCRLFDDMEEVGEDEYDED